MNLKTWFQGDEAPQVGSKRPSRHNDPICSVNQRRRKKFSKETSNESSASESENVDINSDGWAADSESEIDSDLLICPSESDSESSEGDNFQDEDVGSEEGKGEEGVDASEPSSAWKKADEEAHLSDYEGTDFEGEDEAEEYDAETEGNEDDEEFQGWKKTIPKKSFEQYHKQTKWRIYREMERLYGKEKSIAFSKRIYVKYKLDKNKNPENLDLACLSLIKHCDLSKEKYHNIKFWLQNLTSLKLPAWETLKEKRDTFIPEMTIEEDTNSISSGLQETLDNTSLG